MDNNYIKDESLSQLSSSRCATEEEFQNFMHRVSEVGKYVYY
jgi:hypothetical protein